MDIEKLTVRDLHTIALGNMGSMHGDPEALEDMGIVVDPDSLASDLASSSEARRLAQKDSVAPMVGSILCGDCCEDIPRGASCDHLTNPAAGKVRTRG